MFSLFHRCYVFLCIIIFFVEDSYQYCQRFDTLEVLQRFNHKRTPVPLTVEEAVEKGWNFIFKETEYNIDFYCYEHINSIFILYYENELVGVGPTHNVHEPQVKQSKADYKEDVKNRGLAVALPYRFMDTLSRYWHEASHYGKRETFFDREVYIDNIKIRYGNIFFVDPVLLKKGLSPPCTKNTIFIKSNEMRWKQVPQLVSDIQPTMPKLIKQGCQDQRGHYYFYNLKEKTSCRRVHGFFAIYNSQGILSGFGVMIFGESNIEDQTHPLPIYTTIPIPYMREMVPQSQCVRNKGLYGLSLLHIVITPDTQSFTCPKESNPTH